MVTSTESPIPPSPSDFTRCLTQATLGDSAAQSEFFEIVYDELRRLAALMLRSERTGHSLQPTALVHEAWLRIANQDAADPTSKAYFVKVAARAMRRILIDHARHRLVRIEGGQRAEFGDDLVGEIVPAAGSELASIMDLHEHLIALEAHDARKAAVVEMRFFAGLTSDEIALALGTSAATVDRDWRFARAWLHARLGSRPSL
jgi:RNA polymerase sigma factor (TIGR02999 family)